MSIDCNVVVVLDVALGWLYVGNSRQAVDDARAAVGNSHRHSYRIRRTSQQITTNHGKSTVWGGYLSLSFLAGMNLATPRLKSIRISEQVMYTGLASSD
ncbi:hypothetical protein PGTUg99_030145 [Puccinia graminis f. sp. tritici]|uniref:Uncharacterized protein n=1 Tax=Puccinia graminis f. sp. tritici TaxID=56615 RepID=A0A5B0RWL1_PUCGR|nr:hypothetical protein PGTUg99_030145 [Puccinia graminis f. sp. tritici]